MNQPAATAPIPRTALRFREVSATFSPFSREGARRTVACNEPPGADHNCQMTAGGLMPIPYHKCARAQSANLSLPKPDDWTPLEAAAAILRRLVRGEVSPP